jgi:hypothetical protein
MQTPMGPGQHYGIFNTSNYNPQERPVSFGNTIFQKNFQAAPLLAMIAQGGPDTGGATMHKWSIARNFTIRPKLTASVAAGVRGSTTQFPVDNTAGIRQGDTFLVTATNEQVRVDSVLSTSMLSARRAFYQGGSFPIPAGTELLWVGNAVEEASLRPLASGMPNGVRGYMYNFSQIFRHAHAITGTVASTMELAQKYAQGFGMPQIPMDNVYVAGRAETAYHHATSIERALLFSQPHEDTLNGYPIRTMGGLFYMVPTYAPGNVHTVASGSVSFEDLERLLYPSVRSNFEGMPNSKERVILAGRKARYAISKVLEARFQKPVAVMGTGQSFGLSYSKFETMDGMFNVMSHPLFDAYPSMSGTILVADLPAMKTKYLPGRNANYRGWGHMADGTSDDPGVNGRNSGELQATELGIDAKGGDYLSELTAEVSMPDNFAIIRNVCNAAASAPLVAVANKTICIDLDKPCMFGALPPFSQVILTFSNGNAGQVIEVNVPAHDDATGAVVAAATVSVTLDANGNGALPYNVGSRGSYTLCVVADPAAVNAAGISWPGLLYTACVQECLPSTTFNASSYTSSEAANNC